MKHRDFILSPITDILKNVVSASAGIGYGIETYPLSDYIMQSTFIRMTGAQEQKSKCICWELATNDFEYRYLRFTKDRLGDCSNYNEKNKIYKDLSSQIAQRNQEYDFSTRKDDILTNMNSVVENILSGSNLVVWNKREFDDYKRIWANINSGHFAFDKHLLKRGEELINIYNEYLYKKRNSIAHNTESVQESLPTLNTLKQDNYKYENYFLYFSTLTLIDSVLVELYKEYLRCV